MLFNNRVTTIFNIQYICIIYFRTDIFIFFSYLFNLVRNFWQWVQPLSPITLLVIITLLLALAAFTLRGSMKAKS